MIYVYLGFGHPIPIWLAVIGVIAVISTPITAVMYVREALGPHPDPEEES